MAAGNGDLSDDERTVDPIDDEDHVVVGSGDNSRSRSSTVLDNDDDGGGSSSGRRGGRSRGGGDGVGSGNRGERRQRSNNNNNDNGATRAPPEALSQFKSAKDKELIRLALQRSSFFTCLDEEQVENWISAAVLRRYEPGQVVILEGCVDDDDYDDDDEYYQEGNSKHRRRSTLSPAESDDEDAAIPEDIHSDEELDDEVLDEDDSDEYYNDHIEGMDDSNGNRGKEGSSSKNKESNHDVAENDDNDVPVFLEHGTTTGSSMRSSHLLLEEEERRILSDSGGGDITLHDDNDGGLAPSTDPPGGPPRSGIPRAAYIVRTGSADVWYQVQQQKLQKQQQQKLNPAASLGPGHLFGEGGFLFGRQHSASVMASLQPAVAAAETSASYGGSWVTSTAKNRNRELPMQKQQQQPALECWVVDAKTFRQRVLPSNSMSRIFHSYASKRDGKGIPYMTIEDFFFACQQQQEEEEEDKQEENANREKKSGSLLHRRFFGGGGPAAAAAFLQQDPQHQQSALSYLRIANTYNIWQHRKRNKKKKERRQQKMVLPMEDDDDDDETDDDKIYLHDFCLFHLLMSRPDPEVDIAFLLMDRRQTGQIYLEDVAAAVQPVFPELNVHTAFFRRYFGGGSETAAAASGQEQEQVFENSTSIRLPQFSQFLADLPTELGQQAYMRAVTEYGTSDGFLRPLAFVNVLKRSFGWRLPTGVVDRIEEMYCAGDTTSPQATTGSNEKKKDVLLPLLLQGDRCFSFADFVAFQEVLSNLSGICGLIGTAVQMKSGAAVSPDDLKVAHSILSGMGAAAGVGGGNSSSRFCRRQVDVVFQLFDLDRDGYISQQDVVTVCGIHYTRQLLQPSVSERDGTLTFALPPPPAYYKDSNALTRTNTNMITATTKRDWTDVMKDFCFMAVASAVGVVALYPLDLVKTRLMNQRIKSMVPPMTTTIIEGGSSTAAAATSEQLLGRTMYRGSWHCFEQALRVEGFAGLFRGLQPQLLGVAPEKAIKIQVNDMLRQAFALSRDDDDNDHDDDDNVHATATAVAGRQRRQRSYWMNLSLEVLAGACAGACQLLVTNPVEITKIRMQLQGETARMMAEKGISPPTPLQPFSGIVRDLGYSGLYRGALACLLRDVPFSAIYFPAYAASKDYLVQRRWEQEQQQQQHEQEQQQTTRRNSGSSSTTTTAAAAHLSDLLLAGTFSAVPAALVTTPADVIKTRLQVIPRPGEVAYTGIRDCGSKIYQQEGWSGLFRGSFTRVLRIAPQFGISLLAYEQLTSNFGGLVPAEKTPCYYYRPPTNAPVQPRDYRTAFGGGIIMQHNNTKTKEMDHWLAMRNFGASSRGGGGGGAGFSSDGFKPHQQQQQQRPYHLPQSGNDISSPAGGSSRQHTTSNTRRPHNDDPKRS